ncbi:MAG: GDP-mannose 4,6-dehydratase [Candidatus Omnitrophota bacterium]
MLNILVTGGAGFIGSHITEYYAKKGDKVKIIDNLSRASLLGKIEAGCDNNWDYLKTHSNIKLIKGDVRDELLLKEAIGDADVIFHTAAQTAVTTSITNPGADFSNNLIGSFRVLEAVRKSKKKHAIIYCSTNKVYGENINKIDVSEEGKRYSFKNKYKQGIAEDFAIDLCSHSPYGCSKLGADLYMQEYAELYNIKIGVFRMSCIYGTRQFGMEDQGWLAWFIIASLTGQPITVYGDGKQARDVLYVTDLIDAFDRFVNSDLKHGVFNIGGGPNNVISLLELLDMLEQLTGNKNKVGFANWRASDQKLYISDISKIKKVLGWEPETEITDGIKKIVEWVKGNKNLFV